MESRRNFLKKAALLAAGSAGVLPASIQRAFAIDPETGSTYLDAEHVVILMQENRSFDHAYGMLRGVRGFSDPRAMTLPNGNPVWLQTNEAGETYGPFRLNLKDTKATWMGSLPHYRESQTRARNGGKHDRWLTAKRSEDRKEYAGLPLTLGYYNREDIPFYYALADAFTICDQNFCSSLTGTTPNRLHLWSGTLRDGPTATAKPHLHNEEANFNAPVTWKTFPERLKENGISWRVYQNELEVPSGFNNAQEAWLSNYGDNPLEYFTQYNVRFSASHRQHLANEEKSLTAELERLGSQAPSPELQKKIDAGGAKLDQVQRDLKTWSEEGFASLPASAQNLHRNAFVTNSGDPNYRELDSMDYEADGTKRRMEIPKGDVFHQFREDVRTGKLPAVSWIVAPANFSDHPSVPWYGAWYLSEAFDILTQNPEVWKKTIFILCYDENDGYFDHTPPFVPPHAGKPETGKASAGIDTSVEQGSQQELKKSPYADPVGLGYRVPLVVASPWSRGGYVCSEVFDHTSILQFLETFLSAKTKLPIRETNISEWRRTVCGDLTSSFRPYHGEEIKLPMPVERDPFLGSIGQAQFRPMPNDFNKLSADEIAQARQNPAGAPCLPKQEKGQRASCALPYELAVDGILREDQKAFSIRLAAGKSLFGNRSAGSPFFVYAPVNARVAGNASAPMEAGRSWNYAVSAGDALTDEWPLEDFEGGIYHLRVHGPNGFFREFRGSTEDPRFGLTLQPSMRKDHVALQFTNQQPHARTILVEDLSYGDGPWKVNLAPAGGKDASAGLVLKLDRSSGWYDLRIRVEGAPELAWRYAGRLETGREGFSDPCIGRA